jgi:hypothetical protein
MNMTPVIVLACLAGCGTLPHPDTELLKLIDQQNERVERMLPPTTVKDHACPPLPEIPADASLTERKLFTYTLIALYEQCARSIR